VYKYLKGGCKEDRTWLFLVVPRVRTRGHKMKYWRVTLNIRKHFLLWHRLTRVVVESPCLEVFTSHLDTVLGN